MSAIAIINVYDGVNASTYTYSNYFNDVPRPAKTGYERAVESIHSMANFWVQNHGGTYVGHDAEEGGFVVKNDDGEVAMVYYVQILQNATIELTADKIV